MEQIVNINAVLAEIGEYLDGNEVKFFSIKFRKTDGSVSDKIRVRKAGSLKAMKAKAPAPAGAKLLYNLKQKGIVLLQEQGSDRPFAVKISLITHFNGVRVWH